MDFYMLPPPPPTEEDLRRERYCIDLNRGGTARVRCHSCKGFFIMMGNEFNENYHRNWVCDECKYG